MSVTMKKIICTVIAFTMMLQLSVCAKAEISDSQKKELYNFGIMTGDENGNLRLEDNITRAEAAKMLCVLGNLDEEFDEEDGFYDVDEKHWAFGYIASAKKNNIVNGDGNGMFNPNGNVKNEELVKMIVCLLGYGDKAELTGGYPAGYTAEAARLGITSNLKLEVNAYAVRGDAAVMIYNALDVPVVRKSFSDEDNAYDYTAMDGQKDFPYVTFREALVSDKR